MLSFFRHGKSNVRNDDLVQEKKGIIGRYYENGLPVIMRFVDELPDNTIIEKLPFLTVLSWKYDGNKNNGMPQKDINERMIALENVLEENIKTSDIFVHAYSRTGNNLKELVYYSKSQDDFITMLNNALKKHERYPIEIDFYEDKEWSDFKKVLDDFKGEIDYKQNI